MDPDAIVELVHVGSCSSRVEAELKRSALAAHGEQVVVAADDAGGLHPEFAGTSHCGVRLLTPAHRAEAVRELLVELDAGDHALPSPGAHDALAVAGPPSRIGGLLTIPAALLATWLLARAIGLF